MSAHPAPPFTHTVPVPPPGTGEPDLSSLPASPGLFVFEDGSGGTLALTISADVRRRVRAHLAAPDGDDGPSRRVEYRSLTRRIRAVPVGSVFEAEWAYLQHARVRLPTTYRGLVDRWRGWFVHGDPDAPFPRLLATDAPETRTSGVVIGPFPDKRAARQVIAALEEALDLCRYHHLLVLAPSAAPRAYKEMGRCPAPCDGTISLDAYRTMVQDAFDLALAPREATRRDLEAQMRRASAALEFEAADRLRRRLAAVTLLGKPRFRAVDLLERFRFLAVLPSERGDHARLMLVVGARIEPWLDVPLDAPPGLVEEVLEALGPRLEPVDRPDPAPESGDAANLGLVCRHLFRPPKERTPGLLIALPAVPSRKALASALRRIGRESRAAPDRDAYQMPSRIAPNPPPQPGR